MEASTPPSPAASSQNARHDAELEPRSELEILRTNFHEHIDARIHDVGTIVNLVLTLRQLLHLADSARAPRQTVARVRALAAEQLRRHARGACGCDRCLAASRHPSPSALRLP